MWLFSNKVTVRDSGLLEGFRDCHCHLLPGVDDGVQDKNEALLILEEWDLDGVKEVWLTPHIMEDIPNEAVALRNKLEFLTAYYKGNIKLHLAAEHMMDGLFIKLLEGNDVMPIGRGRDKLLVETSYYTPPMNMTNVIEMVNTKGFSPILAHPERYQYMDRNDYKLWKRRGLLLQLNVPSLVGAYGPEVQQKAEWLLKENMYDYCGTDTHSIGQMEIFLNSNISMKTVKKVKHLSENQKL